MTEVGVLRAMNFSLEGPVSCRDPLVASAVVSAVGRRSVRVEVRVKEENSERLILRGEAVLVRVVNGRAAEVTGFVA